MKKRNAIVSTVLTLALGLSVGAAAGSSDTISALLDKGLSVYFNGQEQTLATEAGDAVYPIVYKNTVYLPVRAVSSMFNEPIEFDSKSWSVSIGRADRQPADLVDLSNTGGGEFSVIIRDDEELKISTADGLQQYKNGIRWKIWNGSGSASPSRAIMFNVKGYSEVSFTVWSDIDAKVFVYDQDGEVYTFFDVKAGTANVKTLKLDNNVVSIGFAADGPLGKKGTMKILDATVK